MKTADEIYREMIETFTRETGMEPDGAGEMAVRMYALAVQVYGLYQEAEWTRRQCFPQTATGEELDKHAWLRGLSRNPASRAVGTLRFSVSTAPETDLPIPQGTVCMTAGLVRFETTQAGVLKAGETAAEVPAQAVLAGPGGNTPAGTIRTMAVAPTGIAACTNPAAFSASQVREAVRADLAAWFDGTMLGKDLLLAQIGQRIYQVEGVENYHIASPANDVTVERGQLPVLGTLAVEELV